MKCDAFGKCGSCQLYQLPYPTQVQLKKEELENLLKPFNPPPVEVFTGSESYYRGRGEFRIWRMEDGRVLYGMRKRGDGRKVVPIEECHIVDRAIFDFMPLLRRELEEGNPILKEKLYEVDFLSNSRGELIVTLIYHKKIEEELAEEVRKLRQKYPKVHFVIRKKGRKVVFDQNWLIEELEVEGEKFYYKIVENSFTQPNRSINQKMIGWALDVTQGLSGDLVELYCGNGNFTLPLAKKRFQKVIATEINKESIEGALYGAELNGVKNVTFLAMGVAQFAQLYQEKSPLLQNYRLETILVDPPRAGLDPKTREFVDKFDNIIYISCNPSTLRRDLEQLTRTRKIVRFAFFDQFPYTPHIEAGVFLQRSQ